ncbi:MAG: metal-dependent transcriptional regulator [Gemmatimonadota bacterium]|nr:metal-dependent transcriptional regulator [Gemmatimonadota bacterium]
MATPSTLSESLEDYLEAIYHIEEAKQAARAKDIAERMKVKGSSVTGALQSLARRELVNYSPYDVVTLTEKGRAVASDVVRRHAVLQRFFMNVLGAAGQEAETSACRMEHALHREIMERLVAFVEYLSAGRKQTGSGLIEGFKEYYNQTCKTGGEDPDSSPDLHRKGNKRL